jgi:DNA-binding CsgD family transcriptional regulator
VLRHIAEGASNKEIAQRLGISVRTVESHRDSLMKKVGIKNVAGLTRLALRSGLISDET